MRFPLVSLLGTLLAVLAIARIAALVLHEPMLAFANQYDMVRTGGCVGLYPDIPGAKRDDPTLEAPLERYRLGARTPGVCYWGSEAILAGIVVAKQRLLGRADAPFAALRQLGILKLALAGLAIAAFTIAFWPYPAASLLHGLTALLVLADPVVTLWMQTLYTEFPIFLGIYVVVGSLVAGLLREALAWPHAIGTALGMGLTAYAKEQFFLLPIVLLAVAAPRLWATSRRQLALLCVVALAAPAWHAMLPRPQGIAEANRTDAYLASILPVSRELPRTLTALGLPERCADFSGANWYIPHGESLQTGCPEALALPSTAFLRLARSEPRTLARALVRAIPGTQNPLLGYLGLVANMKMGTVALEPLWVQSLIGPLAASQPALWTIASVLLACSLALPAVVLWIATLMRGGNAHAHPFACYVAMLVLVAGYALGTSVFGDGLVDTSRHYVAGVLAMTALVPAVLCGLALVKDVGRGTRVAGAVALVAALGIAAVATHWAWRQPLAIGVVEGPTTLQVPRAGFSVRGWVLDPRGVAMVRVRSGDRVAQVRAEQMTASQDVARVYPSYPGASSARYEIPIPSDWLAQPELRMRLEVENTAGTTTEIERRRVLPE